MYFYISKNITSYVLCLFLKSSKAFSVSLSKSKVTYSAKLRPADILRRSPKNVLMSSGRPHMVQYVTPKDASLAGRPWDVLRTSI